MTTLTKRAMAASLEKLLTKKTLEKITVKDITDDCGINRQTFYYHFHDVYELVGWIFKDRAAEFMEECSDPSKWRESMSLLLERLLENKALLLNLSRSVNRYQAEVFLQSLIRPALDNVVKDFSEGMDIDATDYDFVLDIFTFGFVGILMEWVAAGMEGDYKKEMNRFFILIECTLESALKRFAK